MFSDDGFQSWLNELGRGENVAAQALWDQYFQRTVAYARRKLEGMPRRAADEEDVALSALNSLVRGVERGLFPQLAAPDDLWRLLLVITARKAIAQRKRASAAKRGGGLVRGESALIRPGDNDGQAAIGQVLGQTPTPEFSAMMSEQCERMLGDLEDFNLRVVALCKLEGYTNEEIASSFDTTTRTVERWLRRIRNQWELKS